MEKRKLYIFTLEPLEKRYTKQWYLYFKKEFSKVFDVEYIDGKYEGDKIKKGRFLDINLTNMYKAQQVEKVSKLFGANKIKDGSIFFFTDFWHFGITAVKYMAQLNNINIKMYGYAHAGTYDEWDFIAQAGLGYWAAHNELAWLKALDGLFVATHFHKNIIMNQFKGFINSNTIHVVGFPMNWSNEISSRVLINNEKRDIIIFPHRLDKEKQPHIFDKLEKVYPKYKFIKSLNVTKDKKDYYELMNKSKICFSASLQETYGIGTVEAVCMGVIPLVPNRLSYVEMYDRMFRYDSYNEARAKLKFFMSNQNKKIIEKKLELNKKKLIESSLLAIPRMIEVMNK